MGTGGVRWQPAPREEVRVIMRIVLGLVMTAVAFAIAGRRLWWLGRLALSGQPAPERSEAVRAQPVRYVAVQMRDVVGQGTLLKWSVPGAAHFAPFWRFLAVIVSLIETWGDQSDRAFAIPGIGPS